MKLPKDLLVGTFRKPNLYLCETDKSKICRLEAANLNGAFKFNSLSELTFEVSRTYNTLSGETKVNPYYNKIEALRLVFLEDFGYFELQGPEIVSDGIKESKSCTAYSSEYGLSQKYLEDFYINTGHVDSVEVLYANEKYGAEANNHIVPVTLYNPEIPELSLLHLVLNEGFGCWTIGHIDASLQTLSRQFEVDRESIYDFLVNEVCEKFNCYIVFDTIKNEINLYAESLTSKFIGDGKTQTFIISPPFLQIGTVSVDGYKTTRWEYNASTGELKLADIPESGAHVEVVDGALTKWETDVFVSFDNLSQEININYDADSIKTVLNVTYGDDLDIREVNLGLPHLTDISYYYTVDWMGQDLYDAYTAYLQKTNEYQPQYTNNSQEILKLNNKISYVENRLSLQYSMAKVGPTTVGTYYIRQKDDDGSEYYKEVSLPSEYVAGTDYYSNATTNLQDGSTGNVSTLYTALQHFFYAHYNKDTQKTEEALAEIAKLSDTFKFMENRNSVERYTIADLVDGLKRGSDDSKASAVYTFLDRMWDELGRVPLQMLYLDPYKKVQVTNQEEGWSNKSNKNYGSYYTTVLFVNSLNSEIKQRTETIEIYQQQRSKFQEANAKISDELRMDDKNFTAGQLRRLCAFLREDELQLDDIVETSLDNLASSFKIKQDAMESGRIELQKLSQPQLQFSMSMANIYALPEFEPITGQFQLGKVIRVALRPDYIKRSRLLEVNINFEDFSDFSCAFGELTSLRTQSDIHADLLSQAITAGKSVATSSSYWTRGSDIATETDLKIQQGLLDATTQIKAIDGTQGIIIDKYGIRMQKIDPVTGNPDPHQTWLTNNMILMSDDGFETSRSALGEITVDGENYYGLIAEMVLSGYIEGSKIVGGTIKIGKQPDGSYAFEVHEDGTVTMSGGSSIGGYTGSDFDDMNNKIQDNDATVKEIQGTVEDIASQSMYRVEVQCNGPMIMNFKNQSATLSCRVYSWDTDITDTLDASLFNWFRTSLDANQDTIWNNNTRHKGVKTLKITTEDISNNANFYCEVSLPE